VKETRNHITTSHVYMACPTAKYNIEVVKIF